MTSQAELVEWLRTSKEVDVAVRGTATVEALESESSHSDLFIIRSYSGRQYVAKSIWDSALCGTEFAAIYEYEGLRLAARRGLSPDAVLVKPELRLVIEDYVEHMPYEISLTDALVVRARLAKHLSGVPRDETLAFERRHLDYAKDFQAHKCLLREASRVNPTIMRQYCDLDTVIRTVKCACCALSGQLGTDGIVLSHNDLVAENVLWDRHGMPMLIDFETVALSGWDFLIGQLAIDSEIDWVVQTGGVADAWHLRHLAQEVLEVTISEDRFLARVAERLVQNIAYGLRQMAILGRSRCRKMYVEQKGRLVDYCYGRLVNDLHPRCW